MSLHVRNSFEFVMDAPVATVFPLFGADRERMWDSSWNPVFMHPSPAEDIAGAVFRVKHGHHDATWINTAFDEERGHIQYVYLLPDVMVTLIDIQLTPLGQDRTWAEVVYERTALSVDGDAVVAHRGDADGKMGPEWAALIDGYLKKTAEVGP
ncbi:hypothetical protein [Acidobacterium sp. S8]|uniref:hypothetical protein n=1 Tax=Acidobacterium sp. S8 TaxID=1641854 RepID=UPI00131B7C45|nr:hypothetical protein [Acidobacterium sp. S8]